MPSSGSKATRDVHTVAGASAPLAEMYRRRTKREKRKRVSLLRVHAQHTHLRLITSLRKGPLETPPVPYRP